MARRKTVPISTKPSNTGAATVGESAAISSAKPPGASDARSEIEPIQTSRTGPLGTIVYGTVYYLSYGVMFSVTLLGACIPGSTLIGRAWKDGSEAGRRKAERFSAEVGITESDPATTGGSG
ncbi:MAG: hypothetical protein ACU843_05045 [Gammaproteobacteria bacterium]